MGLTVFSRRCGIMRDKKKKIWRVLVFWMEFIVMGDCLGESENVFFCNRKG